MKKIIAASAKAAVVAVFSGVFGLTCCGAATSSFTRDLTAAVNTVRQQGCLGKRLDTLLQPHPDLHDAASRIQGGRDIKTALSEAAYRSVRSQAIQLGGHRSIASIQRVLAQQYCDVILNADATEVGIGGTVGSVTILIAKPFVRRFADPQAPLEQVVRLVNAARAVGGQCGTTPFPPSRPMAVNEQLQVAAQAHAQDMADRNYYGHRSLNGHSPDERMRAQGYKSTMTAENIAAGQQSADEVVTGWLKSPGHCRNILMPELVEIGVGVAIRPQSDRGIYWVQNFGAGAKP